MLPRGELNHQDPVKRYRVKRFRMSSPCCPVWPESQSFRARANIFLFLFVPGTGARVKSDSLPFTCGRERKRESA